MKDLNGRKRYRRVGFRSKLKRNKSDRVHMFHVEHVRQPSLSAHRFLSAAAK
jgi:hypothetical protein